MLATAFHGQIMFGSREDLCGHVPVATLLQALLYSRYHFADSFGDREAVATPEHRQDGNFYFL